MSRHTKKHAKASMQNRVREVLLSLGALAGLVSIIIFIAGLAFGITPLIFRSGSMSPTIDTGALAFARTVPASEVQVGDIVSVYDSQGTRITHRVESIDQQGNNLAIAQLRGDANPVTDPDPYVITEADRVFFSVDRLGYVAVWLSGPSGLVLGAIAGGGLLYIAFRPRKGRMKGNPAWIVRTRTAIPTPSRQSSHWQRSASLLSVRPRSVAPRRGTPTRPRQQAFSSALLQPFPRLQAQPVAR